MVKKVIKKKAIKKKVIKKPIKRKSVKKVSGKVKKQVATKKSKKIIPRNSYKRKINLVLKNLIIFALFSILSIILSIVFSSELLSNFFGILAWISGFIFVAFLIIFLAFVFLKTFRK